MKLSALLAIVLAAAGGWYAARISIRQAPAAKQRILFYQSPMHPWVKAATPGKCTVCGMDLVPVYEGGPNFDQAATDVIMLRQGTPNIIGLETIEVKKQPLARTLRVAGLIGEDESRHGVICATVEGRLDGLAMNCEGQQITRRQPIATVFSRTLLAAADEYKMALDQPGPALDKAKRRLEQCGLVWEQIKSIPQRQPDDLYFGMLATLGGTIVKSYVSEGQYVKEGEKLFEVADFTRMWFNFTAYEADLPFIQERQMVTLHAPSLPDLTLKARISFVSPNLDETTRSARVRVVLENPERRIKNKTYAEGTVELQAPEVVAVPRSAVLWPGSQPRVYVEQGTGTYQQRNVRLGRSGDVLWEVLEGLKEGERVVLKGNMLIDSQAQLDKELAQSPPTLKPLGTSPMK